MAKVLCNKCQVGYRIEEAPEGAEVLRCSDCPAYFHTYDEGDVAVVGMPIDQLYNLPHSAERPAANDNDPVRRSLRDAYADPRFEWPFGARVTD